MDSSELNRYRRELAKDSELWQFDLMSPSKLVQFANDSRIRIFNTKTTIQNLWRIGLLRADVIISSSEIEMPALTFVGREGDAYVYCDERPVMHRSEGYGGLFSRDHARDLDLELHFHPFRLFVLYHVARVLDLRITPTQYLNYPEGYPNLQRRGLEHLDSWTSSEQFAERFDYWNQVAELSIVLEPIAYQHIFSSIRWRYPDDEDGVRSKLENWRSQTRAFLLAMRREEVGGFREDLCQSAEIVDDNKMIHVLLRLMAGQERLKLRGSLGASMLFWTMAEVIRRPIEDATGEHLPEEDEIGFGQWMPGAREMIYGSARIFDAPPKVRRNFLTGMGLDYGVKVRCYLEGETEHGAIASAIGDGRGVEFINLQGQVIEKRGKGLSFLASLQNDIKSHVFSLVLLDSDNIDNMRALKKAAADGAFFGRFFISSPDLELGNFTVDELVDALIALATRQGHPLPQRDEILPHVSLAKSGKEFFLALRELEITQMDKGANWGAALMNLAIRSPNLPHNHAQAGKIRPLFEAARFIRNLQQAGYADIAARFKVDPATGKLPKK